MALRRGRLSRLARLGGLAAEVAGGTAGLAGGLMREGSDVALAAFHRRTAERLADALGEMKGLPHKVGQILSVLEGALPTEHRAVYGEVLTRLQAQAQAMPWSDLAPVLEADLGQPVERAFATLDPEPVAAASIGQVHRATLPDGRAVAVKVQYPGVRAALEADLKNVEALVRTLTAAMPKTDVRGLIDDIRATFEDELDYAHEAAVQQACAQRWSGQAGVVVPVVVPERCGARVLTTTWIDGAPFSEACAASEALRDTWGQRLWDFTWTSITAHRWIHGDPHPGNFRFLPDGRVAILDFGASAELPVALADGMAAAARAARAGADDAGLLRHVLPAVGLPRDLAPDVARPWGCFSRLLFAPMQPGEPFRFTQPYLADLMAEIQAAKTAAAKTALWKGVPTPSTQGTVLLMRTAIGQAAVLAHLNATVRG
jgi:predicted unusual protein kinase regulating ubiquinone biosynthesis (AarF/ABC1/UbiB family)